MVQDLLEQLVVAELVTKYPASIESKISYSHYVKSSSGSHPEPVGFRPQFYNQFIEATFHYHTASITPLDFLSTFCMQHVTLKHNAPFSLSFI